MGQPPKDRLLELGAELALLGEQVGLARLQLYSVVDAGYSLSSPEALEANRRFDIISNQFLTGLCLVKNTYRGVNVRWTVYALSRVR